MIVCAIFSKFVADVVDFSELYDKVMQTSIRIKCS